MRTKKDEVFVGLVSNVAFEASEQSAFNQPTNNRQMSACFGIYNQDTGLFVEVKSCDRWFELHDELPSGGWEVAVHKGVALGKYEVQL